MEFVLAKEKDFDLIYDMMLRAKADLIAAGIFQWNDDYPSAEMLLSDIRNSYTYLVKEEGRTLAFFTSNSICEDDVHDHIKWLYPDSNYLILHRLCVEPQRQGQGIGQRILEQFEKRAQADGYDSIRIDVFATNETAIHIYEKFGYTRVGEAVCERGLFYIYERRLRQ